jgi:hypothetical protein
MSMTRVRRPVRRIIPAGVDSPEIVVVLDVDGTLSLRQLGKHRERVFHVSALLNTDIRTLGIERRVKQGRKQPILLDMMIARPFPPKRKTTHKK